MVYIKDWIKYYSIEESIKITDDYIEKSADEMILEIRKKRAEKAKTKIFNNEYAYV